MSKTLRLPPLKRIEGHGRVALFLGDDGRVADAHFEVIEFRGFEKLLEGRMLWEMPLLTSRVCGVCPVSHHLTAVKAAESVLGVVPPRPGRLLRELMHLGGFIQDHALHFFFLAGPDFLIGEGASRDLLGVLGARPELARDAVTLRKAGLRVVEAVGGQAGHPVTAIPGGVSKPLDARVRDELRGAIVSALPLALAAAGVARDATLRLLEGPFPELAPTPFLATAGPGGAFELYDGPLVASAPDGSPIAEFGADEFFDRVAERVLPYSYAKAPYLAELGPEAGTYRVGPLARINAARRMPGPESEVLLADFRTTLGAPQSPLAYHWARMIELVAAVERASAILDDHDVASPDVRVRVERGGGAGAGAIEAPRGTLVHRYEADPVGRVMKADLVVATTQNNPAIDAVVKALASEAVADGEVTEEGVKRIELGIRAYDPCLSCATHEAGRLPLVVETLAPDGRVVSRKGVAS